MPWSHNQVEAQSQLRRQHQQDQQHHAIHFPVMDQTSLIWRKKIKAMEKVEPQSPVYPLMTTAKCLHALNILYEDKKWELKIWTTKPKEEKKENLL